MLRFGRFELHAIDLGALWVDGGALYGSVPKTVWGGFTPPDDANRVRLALRALLLVEAAPARGSGRRILVDVGMGETFRDDPATGVCYQAPVGGLKAALAKASVTPEDITDVILTHLHLEHAGGAIAETAGGPSEPAFPRATFHVQRRALKWSGHPTEKDCSAFDDRIADVLARAGCLHLLDGPAELFDGVSLILSEGHTVGQQLPLIEADDGKLLFCGDAVPTRAHIRTTWLAADDLYPLTSLEEKKLILAEALDESWALVFPHDPTTPACLLTERGGEVAGGDVLDL